MSVTREQYNPTHKIYMYSFSRFCFVSFDFSRRQLSVAVQFFSSSSLNNLSKIECSVLLSILVLLRLHHQNC